MLLDVEVRRQDVRFAKAFADLERDTFTQAAGDLRLHGIPALLKPCRANHEVHIADRAAEPGQIQRVKSFSPDRIVGHTRGEFDRERRFDVL